MDRPLFNSAQHRLQEAGTWAKKSLGQHFLVDRDALQTILATAALTKNDSVVEVGPGMGVLSQELLQRAGKVIAFEYDPEMVKLLEKDFPELEVVAGDVLRTAPERLKEIGQYKVVANIPYQITTPLIGLFLESELTPPQSLTLLVQKEVGERLTAPARASERRYLSVLAEYFAEVTYVQTVPAASFFPAPQVDSAIIHLQVRKERLFPKEEEKKFLRFVHTYFINPRKQLKNVYAGIKGLSQAEVGELFAVLGFSSTVRAQELSLEDWKNLYTHA